MYSGKVTEEWRKMNGKFYQRKCSKC
jgi:hypothetical protein